MCTCIIFIAIQINANNSLIGSLRAFMFLSHNSYLSHNYNTIPKNSPKLLIMIYVDLIIYTASASGDPHYWSFDRRYYDFMGEGKFVAFRIQNPTDTTIEFELQAKHERWRGTTATIQTSLVFGVPGTKAVYQVSLLITIQKPIPLKRKTFYSTSACIYIIQI